MVLRDDDLGFDSTADAVAQIMRGNLGGRVAMYYMCARPLAFEAACVKADDTWTKGADYRDPGARIAVIRRLTGAGLLATVLGNLDLADDAAFRAAVWAVTR